MNAGGKTTSIAILGAGYVGAELARLVIARRWRVAALTRNPEKADALRALGCERVVEADIASEAWSEEMHGPFSFVVNCVSPGGGGIEGYRRSCVAGMNSVGVWLATMPAGTVVYTSSTGVYPQGDGARVDESALTETGEGSGGLLREAESILESAANAAGWRWFALRLAGIYGPGRHHVLDQLRSGGTLRGDSEVRLNLIHRDDVCAAILACLESQRGVAPGIFNLSDNSPHSRGEVAAWIARELGLPEPRFDDAPAPNPFGRRRTPDRVIVANRIHKEIGWSPRHPDFRSGFGEILGGG
ncbi:MAG TPA: NAD-dependent epimerase/dehydratase family protein [Opitutaceae bacterium]|nr:NAD-dependent epimerase/dehydratase family protein [Opitutaceae bacterium]